MNPLGLYLHVPFCTTKCGYCDFYSVPLGDRSATPLVRALIQELHTRVNAAIGPISTVFVGGGTPTVLPPAELAELMLALRDALQRQRPAEFTVEANPGTLSNEKLSILVDAGVDRISLGGQSFHQRELDALERIHHPEDIPRAVELCRRHGIGRLNLDLIFGIPGQTPASWRTSLQQACELGVDHLSAYGLTYEPGTALTRRLQAGRLRRCPEATEVDLYAATVETLAAADYAQYEISNYARPGQQCRHNLAYWDHQPYIGIGPSAAGYVNGRRYKNIAGIESYVRRIAEEGHAIAEAEQVSGTLLAGESAMLQLRLNRGLRFERFRQVTGLDARVVFARSIEASQRRGRLRVTEQGVALTPNGRLMADTVIAEFFEEVTDRDPGNADREP